MPVEQIFTLIGSFGFPIVMCVLMFVYNNKTIKELTKSINDLKNYVFNSNTLLKTFLNRKDDDENG